jgi:putative lipoic acid-binding regulatory protein
MNDTSNPDSGSPLKFPCSFPIKVMGHRTASFETLVVGLISDHVGEIPLERVRSQASSNGRYVSITVTIEARSRTQLDAVYRSLTACSQVLMVL